MDLFASKQVPLPRLILLDFAMPGMDGPEVSKALNSMFSEAGLDEKTTPFVSCWASYTDVAFKKKAAESGMKEYLIKPVREATLKKLVLRLGLKLNK